MNITNINHITGERVTLFDVQMTFGDVIIVKDGIFQFTLCDRFTHSPLFEIILNTKFWGMVIEELHYNHQIAEDITKDDVDSIPNFIRTVKMFVMQIPNVSSYFDLLKVIQNRTLSGVPNVSTHTTPYTTSLPPTQSFSHLSGSLGQPINPNKKRFLSKATAKMPVTMSVVDDELW